MTLPKWRVLRRLVGSHEVPPEVDMHSISLNAGKLWAEEFAKEMERGATIIGDGTVERQREGVLLRVFAAEVRRIAKELCK